MVDRIQRAREHLGNLDKSDYILILMGLMFLVLIINLILTIVFRHRDCDLEQPVVNIFNETPPQIN